MCRNIFRIALLLLQGWVDSQNNLKKTSNLPLYVTECSCKNWWWLTRQLSYCSFPNGTSFLVRGSSSSITGSLGLNLIIIGSLVKDRHDRFRDGGFSEGLLELNSVTTEQCCSLPLKIAQILVE